MKLTTNNSSLASYQEKNLIMERFNGGSYGNAPRVMRFHSSSPWNAQLKRSIDGGLSYGRTVQLSQWNYPNLDRIDGGVSYGRTLQLSQWKAPSGRTSDGGSYGKASRVIEFHSSSQWKAHFEASKQTNKLMVLYFTATWCGPCRAMEPAINDMAAKFTDVEFIKIDTDKLVSVSMQFGVQTMPTFILLKNGKEVDKVVAVKKEELQMKVAKHRVQLYY